MEPIGSIAARVTSLPSPEADDPKAAREQFRRALSAFADAYRHELSDDAIRVYWQALRHIPVEIRGEGMARCVQTIKFFPTVTEVLTACADVVDERRAKAKRLAEAFQDDCPHCVNSRGWREVLIDGVSRAVRCDCWKRGQELIQAAGQALKRPALPPAPEPAA